jgi:hypothetical protein
MPDPIDHHVTRVRPAFPFVVSFVALAVVAIATAQQATVQIDLFSGDSPFGASRPYLEAGIVFLWFLLNGSLVVGWRRFLLQRSQQSSRAKTLNLIALGLATFVMVTMNVAGGAALLILTKAGALGLLWIWLLLSAALLCTWIHAVRQLYRRSKAARKIFVSASALSVAFIGIELAVDAGHEGTIWYSFLQGEGGIISLQLAAIVLCVIAIPYAFISPKLRRALDS